MQDDHRMDTKRPTARRAGPSRLFEQPKQIDAPMTHVDDLHAVRQRPIDDDVPSAGNHETAVSSPKLRTRHSHPRMLRETLALPLQPLHEAKRGRRTVPSDVVVNLHEIAARLCAECAAPHLERSTISAFRRLNSSNTSPEGTTRPASACSVPRRTLSRTSANSPSKAPSRSSSKARALPSTSSVDEYRPDSIFLLMRARFPSLIETSISIP